MARTLGTMVRTVVTLLVGVAAGIGIVQMWPASAAPGDTDTTFVPVTPCRLFDYRPAPSTVGSKTTPLAAGQAYTQQVTGNVGNCTGPNAVPTGAMAVALNVTAINPTAQSNLRIYPANVAAPLVSNLNFSAGQKPIANKVDVKLSPDGKIKLLNQNGTVAVAGDVVGYYTGGSLKSLQAQINALRTETITLSGAGMTPTVGSATSTFQGCTGIAGTVHAGRIPVQLPVGAKITNVTYDVYDSTDPLTYTVQLLRTSRANTMYELVPVAPVTAGASTSLLQTHSVNLSPAETVGADEGFVVDWSSQITLNGLCEVRITFTR